MTTEATLESLLSKAYVAMAMGKGDIAAVLSEYADAAQADSALTPLAQSTYATLSALQTSGEQQRCYVSRTRAEFLRRALGK